MDVYNNLIELAKSIRWQNLFIATKEINGIRLFHNIFNFSKIQEIFLNYLYTFDSINRDIVIEKISKHVLDHNIYWESYLLWRKQKKDKSENNKKRDVSLVASNKIKFPKRGK